MRERHRERQRKSERENNWAIIISSACTFGLILMNSHYLCSETEFEAAVVTSSRVGNLKGDTEPADGSSCARPPAQQSSAVSHHVPLLLRRQKQMTMNNNRLQGVRHIDQPKSSEANLCPLRSWFCLLRPPAAHSLTLTSVFLLDSHRWCC